jgi:hypothetical protein
MVSGALLIGIVATALAQRRDSSQAPFNAASGTTAKIVAAAEAFLTTLDDAGRAKVRFPFDSLRRPSGPTFRPASIRVRA